MNSISKINLLFARQFGDSLGWKTCDPTQNLMRSQMEAPQRETTNMQRKLSKPTGLGPKADPTRTQSSRSTPDPQPNPADRQNQNTTSCMTDRNGLPQKCMLMLMLSLPVCPKTTLRVSEMHSVHPTSMFKRPTTCTSYRTRVLCSWILRLLPSSAIHRYRFQPPGPSARQWPSQDRGPWGNSLCNS